MTQPISERVSDDKLSEWRAIAEQATPGPWDHNGTGVWSEAPCPGEPYDEDCEQCLHDAAGEPVHYIMALHKAGWWPLLSDAQFVVAAREALPALLDEVASLQAELESVKKLSEERRQMLSDISVKGDSNARYDGLCAACGYGGDFDSPEHTDCDLPRLTALETVPDSACSQEVQP